MAEEIEIEKKYEVKRLPENLMNFEHMTIEQSYLNKGGSPIRLRKFIKKDEINYIFSKKVRVDSNEFECIEHNVNLSESLYNELLNVKEGRTIIKTRFKIPLEDGLKVDLDVYHDFFEGVCVAEIEYASIEQAKDYKTPNWLGEELSNLKKMSNSYMATKAKDIMEYIKYIPPNLDITNFNIKKTN